MKSDFFTTSRLEAFSDGVIAIIITLMILEIKIPALEHESDGAIVWQSLFNLLPHILTYTVSFMVVAIMWVNHHNIFQNVEKTDVKLLWLNLHLLFWMSLIPLPTEFLGEHPWLPQAAIFYGAILFMTGLAFSILRQHANMLMLEKADEKVNRKAVRQSYFSAVLYLSSAIAPLIHPSLIYYSMFIFVLIPVIYFFPERIAKKN